MSEEQEFAERKARQIDDLNEEISRLRCELEAANQLIESQREGITLLRSNNNLLEKERDELAAKCAAMEKERDEYKRKGEELMAGLACLMIDTHDGKASKETLAGFNSTRARAMLKASKEVERLKLLINSPQTGDFMEAVKLEAAHQQERWGTAHDAGKKVEDWFWLLGYLAGKSLAAFKAKDSDKGKHHIISSAACLLNWHRHVTGEIQAMRPGIDSRAYDAGGEEEI